MEQVCNTVYSGVSGFSHVVENRESLLERLRRVSVPDGVVPGDWDDRDLPMSVAVNVFCPTGEGGGKDPTCRASSTKSVRSFGKMETLHAAHCEGPGCTRQEGKDKKGNVRHFYQGERKWVGADGNALPKHVQNLKIPPDWKEVYVNMDSKGTRLVVAKDSKGRTQARYNSTTTAKQAAAKFKRIRDLRKKRGKIFKEIDRDAKKPTLKDKAECLKLIMQTGMRPGSDGDTKAAHKSYGATTLEGRHVKVGVDGSVSIRCVTGKSHGQEKEFPISDSATASMLKRRASEVGADGRLFDTNAGELRTYSKSKDGKGFKTKDHRTALATEVAIQTMKGVKQPTSEREYKKAVKEVATKVSSTIGNTPSVALKSYIDPTIFGVWRQKAGV